MYRALAHNYQWDASQVSRLTPAQILMYCGPDAAVEQDSETRIDPKTGHRIVRAKNYQEALQLLDRLKQQKRARNG